MSGESDSRKTHLTDKGRQAAEEREKRLAEALRANLHRRKAQSRARTEQVPAPEEGDGG